MPSSTPASSAPGNCSVTWKAQAPRCPAQWCLDQISVHGTARLFPFGFRPALGDNQRLQSERKNVVTSAASRSGASSAAKCPPRGISVHRWMLKTCSANERGGCRISRGKDA
jgi:hypothetical protein